MDAGDFEITRATGISAQSEFGGNKFPRNDNYGGGFSQGQGGYRGSYNRGGGYNNHGGSYRGNNRGGYGYNR